MPLNWLNLFSRWEYAVEILVLRWSRVCEHKRWLGILHRLWHYSRFLGRTLLCKFYSSILNIHTILLETNGFSFLFVLEILSKDWKYIFIWFLSVNCKSIKKFSMFVLVFFLFVDRSIRFEILTILFFCHFFLSYCFEWLSLWIQTNNNKKNSVLNCRTCTCVRTTHHTCAVQKFIQSHFYSCWLAFFLFSLNNIFIYLRNTNYAALIYGRRFIYVIVKNLNKGSSVVYN